jgi:hypothetical protein
MSPSCTNGLSSVGFSPNIRAKTNFLPRSLIQHLTTGRLGNAQRGKDDGRDTDCSAGGAECTSLPRVEIRAASGKGLGLFAVDDIPAYSKILEDYALLSLAEGEDIPELWQKYSVLPPDEKQDFDSLGFSSHQLQKEDLLISKLKERGYGEDEAKNMVRVQSRFMANAFKEDSDKWRATLFLTVARINHSCTPNAQTHYRPSSGAKVLYSFRDIGAGEEIEISYFGITLPYTDRQNRAKSWGFTCQCPACLSMGTPQSAKYERAVSQIRSTLDHALDRSYSLGPNVASAASARDAIDAALDSEYPWLVAALPNLYIYLASWLDPNTQHQEERCAALQSALKWESRITGPDSPFSVEKRRQLKRLFPNSEEE